MADYYLEFEKPIQAIDEQILELEADTSSADHSVELSALRTKRETSLKKIFSGLSRWQRVQLARHPQRPFSLDYIQALAPDFIELHGDRYFGDDPAINNLERRVAEILGKEAAVYMPSGTMTNQVAIRTHTEPGDEILLEQSAHVYFNEAGATAALSGVICRLISGDRGVFGAEDLEASIRPVNNHYPRTKLVCVENTTNRGGGKVWRCCRRTGLRALMRVLPRGPPQHHRPRRREAGRDVRGVRIAAHVP